MSEHRGPREAEGLDAGHGRSDGAGGAFREQIFHASRVVRAASGSASPDANGGRHLDRDVLWRFMTGGLSIAEMRHAFGHLLRGCATCRQQAREVWNLAPQAKAAPAVAATVGVAVVDDGGMPAASALEPPVPLAAGGGRELHALPRREPIQALGSIVQETLARLEAAPPSHASAAATTSAAPSPSDTDDAQYDGVLDRVFSRIAVEEAGLEAAGRRADELFEELMQHPPARQQLLIHNSARFRDRMLCERLLAASHDEGFREPARSHQLARTAVAVVERMAEMAELPEMAETAEIVEEPHAAAPAAEPPLCEAIAGLRARAWAQLGNALRIGSDLDGAAEAFRNAEALLAAHPRLGLLDKARVFDLESSYYKDRRQFAVAGRLLDRVIAIYKRLGQVNLTGRALAQKALLLSCARDLEGSMGLLRRALELIDPHEDPRWFLIVRHNLILALVDDDKPREAFALLFHTRPLYLKMGDRMNLLRLRWLEGQVARGLHRLEQAEAAFREVRAAFVELGLEYDAALVSLDLASILAQQGRSTEMRRLAEEMLIFFESHRIVPEAMAALMVFCDAARQEQAGIALVQEIAAFLKQARLTPDTRFVPSR